MYKRICGILLIIATCTCGALASASAVSAVSSGIYISEIRISGQADPKEYVELLNVSNEIVDLSGYRLEYAKPTFLAEYCNEVDWKLAAEEAGLAKVVNTVQLQDVSIQPRGRVYIILSMNNDIAGSIRLSSTTGEASVVHELVGWGNADAPPPCVKGSPADIPVKGAVIKRLLDEDGVPVIAENNAEEFILSQHPTPTIDECPINNPCVDELPGGTDPPVITPVEYLPLWLSEALPDPTDLPDDQGEFIEIFNPNPTAVSLEGYALQTGSVTSKKYILPNYVLNAHEYLAVYSSESGLNLSNSGSSARIYSPDNAIADEMPAYEPIKAGAAWARLGDKWDFTDLPTPKAENKPTPQPEIPVVAGASTVSEDAPKPCQDGWYRNPETNRCKKIETAVAVAYAPCAEGYERNPETNRCRKIVTESLLQPCAPGEERNPETNRCRKIVQPVAAVAGINTSDNNSEQSSQKTWSLNWLIGSALAGVVVSYGVYEWRHEIISGLRHLRDKINAKQ